MYVCESESERGRKREIVGGREIQSERKIERDGAEVEWKHCTKIMNVKKCGIWNDKSWRLCDIVLSIPQGSWRTESVKELREVWRIKTLRQRQQKIEREGTSEKIWKMFTVEFVFFSLLPRKLAVTRAFPQHHWVYILCILCYMIFFFKEKKFEVFSSNSLQYFYMAVVHLSRLSKRSAKILSHCILISFFAHPLQKKKKLFSS